MKFLILILSLVTSSIASAAYNCPQIGLDERQALGQYDFNINSCVLMGSDSLVGVNSSERAELHIYLCRKNDTYYKVALAHSAIDLIKIMNTSMGFNCPSGDGKAVFWIDEINL